MVQGELDGKFFMVLTELTALYSKSHVVVTVSLEVGGTHYSPETE